MLSKDELRQRRTDFWSGFKSYMRAHRSSNGRKMNWLNYPTDLKDIYLRLDTDSKGVRVCLDIQSKDPGIRAVIWEQMGELKKVLTDAMGDPGEWLEDYHNSELMLINRIQWERKDLNFFNEADHPEIYAFLEKHLLGFDEFYQNFKDVLVHLVK